MESKVSPANFSRADCTSAISARGPARTERSNALSGKTAQGLIARGFGLELHQTREIQIQHRGAAAFHHLGMEFEQTADDGFAMQNIRGPAGMLVRLRGLGRTHRDSRQ